MNLRQQGFTLIELMSALAITGFLIVAMSAGMVSISKVITHSSRAADAEDSARMLQRILTELIQQAEICASCSPAKSVSITYPSGKTEPNATLFQSGDSITVDLLLPTGYASWPNDVSPYAKPAVRISWSASGTGDVTIANAATTASLGGATPMTLHSGAGRAPVITNLDVWPLDTSGNSQPSASSTPDGGYRVCVTARENKIDPGFINPQEPTGAMRNYRTATACGTVFPRNW